MALEESVLNDQVIARILLIKILLIATPITPKCGITIKSLMIVIIVFIPRKRKTFFALSITTKTTFTKLTIIPIIKAIVDIDK